MIGSLSASFVYSLFKDLLAYMRGMHRGLTPVKRIELRQKWKSQFEEKLFETNRKKLRKDIIIRDVKRVDDYPNLNPEEKGISPWFRVGLVDTYHKGIMVGMEWREVVGQNCLLVGYIPFENIEAVDWRGDEYYNFPIVYCHFDEKDKQPYERLAYCEEKHLNDIPFYTEVISFEEASKLKKKSA